MVWLWHFFVLVLFVPQLEASSVTVVALSTTAFGDDMIRQGLRATHRPSQKDKQLQEQALHKLVIAACQCLYSHDTTAGPGSSESLSAHAHGAKFNFWKFARVSRQFEHQTHQKGDGPCLVLSHHPPVVLCGDYLAGSNFGAVAQSAAAAARALARSFGKRIADRSNFFVYRMLISLALVIANSKLIQI